MKKNIYNVMVGRMTMDGWYKGVEVKETVLATAHDVLKYVEEVKQEIERRGQWWMDTAKGNDGRPMVYAEKVEVKEL